MSDEIERAIRRDIDQLPVLPQERWVPALRRRTTIGTRMLSLLAGGAVMVAALAAGNALAYVRSDKAPASGAAPISTGGCATTPITDWKPTTFLFPRNIELVVGGRLGSAPFNQFSPDHYWYLRDSDPRPVITMRAERLDLPAPPVLIFAVGYALGDGFPSEWSRNWYYRTSGILAPPDPVGCWRVALEDDPQSAIVIQVKLQDRRATDPVARAGATGVCAAARARVLAMGATVRRADRVESKRVTAAELSATGMQIPTNSLLAETTPVCVVAVSGQLRPSLGLVDPPPSTSTWGLFVSIAGSEMWIGSATGSGDWPPGFDALAHRPENLLPGTVTEVVGPNTVRIALESAVLSAEFGNPMLLRGDKFTEITPYAVDIAASVLRAGDRVAIFFEREGRDAGGAYPMSVLQITSRAAPAREPKDLAVLPQEGAILRAFSTGGVAIRTVGGSVIDTHLGPRMPARSFVVGPNRGADLIMLDEAPRNISACATSAGSGRTTIAITVNGQPTATIDSSIDVWFLASARYFAEVYDQASYDALRVGLGLSAIRCAN